MIGFYGSRRNGQMIIVKVHETRNKLGVDIQEALNIISTLSDVKPIWPVSGKLMMHYKNDQTCYYAIANATRRYKGKGKFKAHIGNLYGRKCDYKDIWVEYIGEDKK